MAVTDMNVKFLKSASVGDTLVAVAHQHSGGNLLQVWDATIKVRDSDLEVALIRGTAMNLYTKKKSTFHLQLPPGLTDFFRHRVDPRQIYKVGSGI